MLLLEGVKRRMRESEKNVTKTVWDKYGKKKDKLTFQPIKR